MVPRPWLVLVFTMAVMIGLAFSFNLGSLILRHCLAVLLPVWRFMRTEDSERKLAVGILISKRIPEQISIESARRISESVNL